MPKNSKSLIALLLGLVIFAVAYFGAYGQYNNWVAAKDAFEISNTENIRLKAAQSAANDFMAKYESNRDKAELANKVLPLGDPDTPIILANFEQIADESGMVIKKLEVLEDSTVSDPVPNVIKTVDVGFTLVGSYEAFNNFLLRMQRNLRLVDLIEIQVSAGDGESANGTSLEYTLTFRAYYQE